MPRRSGYLKQRRRFLVACEGDSERSYAALLQRLADESGLAIHMDIRKGHGGDPLAIVEYAVKQLSARRIRRGAYVAQAIILDADRRNDVPHRTEQADRLIDEYGFHAIWSTPCLEALLLKHMPGCEQLQAATTALALQRLRNRWPEYSKGMTANDLRSRIDLNAVTRAAKATPVLRTFLTIVGLLE